MASASSSETKPDWGFTYQPQTPILDDRFQVNWWADDDSKLTRDMEGGIISEEDFEEAIAAARSSLLRIHTGELTREASQTDAVMASVREELQKEFNARSIKLQVPNPEYFEFVFPYDDDDDVMGEEDEDDAEENERADMNGRGGAGPAPRRAAEATWASVVRTLFGGARVQLN